MEAGCTLDKLHPSAPIKGIALKIVEQPACHNEIHENTGIFAELETREGQNWII
jgi:hypothetical protein